MAAPVITSIAPSLGPVLGGNVVVITGSGFGNPTPPPEPSFINGGTSGAGGTEGISGGSSSTSSSGVIDGGNASTGEAPIITPLTVLFGTVPAISAWASSFTSITAVVPPQGQSSVGVTVQTTNGTSNASVYSYTYLTPLMSELWSQLSGYVTTLDDSTGNELLSFIALALEAMGLEALDELVRDNGYIPGWSALLDVTRCPTNALPWLGQLVGVNLFDAGDTDPLERSAIIDMIPSQRGTIAAILASMTPFLSIAPTTAYANGQVTISERTPDAYSISIHIAASLVGVLTYNQLAINYPTYAAIAAAFPVYNNFSANTSGLEAAIQAAIPAGLKATITIS